VPLILPNNIDQSPYMLVAGRTCLLRWFGLRLGMVEIVVACKAILCIESSHNSDFP